MKSKQAKRNAYLDVAYLVLETKVGHKRCQNVAGTTPSHRLHPRGTTCKCFSYIMILFCQNSASSATYDIIPWFSSVGRLSASDLEVL